MTASDLANAAVTSPFAVAKTSLRHDYVGVEETLAQMASSGQLSADEVVAIADRHTAGRLSRRELAPLTAAGVSALAYWTIGRSRDPAAAQRAAVLFALGRRLARRDRATAPHPDVALQVALTAGQVTAPDDKLISSIGADPWVRWAVRADLANPFASPTPEGLAAWYEVFDEPFTTCGLDPVRIDETDDPFARLTTASHGARAGSVHGPLVTIVVPVYATGGDDLLLSVRSVLQQTWANLQIIVVDDASPTEHREIFDRVAALDDRVEVLRKPVNGGAYVARNAGIAHARGDFIGVQDADDWSHPERIERQMAALEADPSLMATLSKAVYLHRDLRITTVGTAPLGRHLPSLLFRRNEVLQRLGQFDPVRKAADGEFVERLIAAFGRPAIRTLDEPLALYQLTDDSLSRDDFRIGWHRHTRVSYRSAYRQWHRRIALGTADPHLGPGAVRAFPAPPRLEGVAGPARFDVIVLSDTRDGSVALTGLVDQLAALNASGLTVGVARAEPLRLSTANRIYPADVVADAVAAGHAQWTSLTADVATDLLLVRDPDLLAEARAADVVRVRPDRVVVIADRHPRPQTIRPVSYDPAAIERTTLHLFGIRAQWLPSSHELGVALTDAGATGLVHPPQLVDIVAPGGQARHAAIGRPTLGVDDASSYAAERIGRTTLLAHLPRGDAHDVRLRQPSRRSVDPHWLTFAATDVTSAELFDQCDFVVGLPAVTGDTTLIHSVFAAMARGCVPVVPESYRPILGDAALYYGERTVTEIVDDCWNDRDTLHDRQELARRFCTDRLSAEAAATTISSLRSTDPAP
ncbi:glycosyltransferase [Aeromicrobium sp. UC242_57]|uniref:glycosyltransferase n=1 Tax=Aeromicrobium sp. UC242_57 TaxID=3374624 RepID=UPI0037B2B650